MSRWIDAEWLLNFFEPYPNDYQTPLGLLRACVDDAPSIDLVRCAECRWSRPRTLKGETGYRCVFYRVDKAETGYCDIGEREGE
jgi:hypothetical protein